MTQKAVRPQTPQGKRNRARLEPVDPARVQQPLRRGPDLGALSGREAILETLRPFRLVVLRAHLHPVPPANPSRASAAAMGATTAGAAATATAALRLRGLICPRFALSPARCRLSCFPITVPTTCCMLRGRCWCFKSAVSIATGCAAVPTVRDGPGADARENIEFRWADP